MSVPAAADLAAAGLVLTIDGPRVTIAVDRQDRVIAGVTAGASVLSAAFADIGRSLPGNVRLVVLRVVGGPPPSGHPRVDPGVHDGLDGADEDLLTEWQAAFGWLSRPDLFSIAVVSGYAVDGLHLALACDLRVLCDDAYLTLTGIHRGRIPAFGVSHALVDLVGYGRALDLCVTGRGVRAPEAVAFGLADRVAAPADLGQAVEDLAAALLAAPREPAIEVKALLLRSRERSRPDQQRAERDAQLRCSWETEPPA